MRAFIALSMLFDGAVGRVPGTCHRGPRGCGFGSQVLQVNESLSCFFFLVICSCIFYQRQLRDANYVSEALVDAGRKHFRVKMRPSTFVDGANQLLQKWLVTLGRPPSNHLLILATVY